MNVVTKLKKKQHIQIKVTEPISTVLMKCIIWK